MNSSTIAATTITWSAPNAAARWSSFRARLNALSRKLAARTSTCRRATPSRFTAYANAVRRSRSAAWREVTNGAWKRVFCAWSADRAQAQNLEYTVYWAGPERWRAEWSGPDVQQITILNNGKLSYVTSTPESLWSAIELQAALAALDGGTPAGPYRLAPLAYEEGQLRTDEL